MYYKHLFYFSFLALTVCLSLLERICGTQKFGTACEKNQKMMIIKTHVRYLAISESILRKWATYKGMIINDALV